MIHILGSRDFLWSKLDKHDLLEIRKNGTEIVYCGHGGYRYSMVRADRPITRKGQFYFEVLIVNSGIHQEIGVGICTKASQVDRFPGWDTFSFGYHGDDGGIYCESETATFKTEEKFESGDEIGVLLDFNTATLTFSKNKNDIKTIKLEANHMNQDFYPSVGIYSEDAIIQLKSTKSFVDNTIECICTPFKPCWEIIKPYVWDPLSNFFDYYKNHFNTLKFIGTNVCLSLVDVGSDINTAIAFFM